MSESSDLSNTSTKAFAKKTWPKRELNRRMMKALAMRGDMRIAQVIENALAMAEHPGHTCIFYMLDETFVGLLEEYVTKYGKPIE